MSIQAQGLATTFDAVNKAVIASIDGCSEIDWRATSAEEHWSVAVVAHHIGEVAGNFTGFITGVTSAESHQASVAQDDVDRMNATHARQYANVGKSETLALVKANGSALSELVAGLTDDQLAQIAGVFVGHELTVRQLMELAVIAHFQEHLNSINATISD